MKLKALYLLLLLLAGSKSNAQSYAGLWIGTATVDSVSEPQSGPVVPTSNSLATLVPVTPPQVILNAVGVPVATNYFTTNYLQLERTSISLSPTPVAQPALLRLLVHVNADNKASLLKDVAVMTTRATPAVPETRTVLITDKRFYPDYDGIIRNGSALVPKRLSTTHFDFTGNHLPMTGFVGIQPNSAVTVKNVLPFDAPSNPFRHKFHPDHDNLDAHFSSTKQEAYTIQRVITLEFSPVSLQENGTADYGYTVLEGFYSENVTGLMRTNIIARGKFQLKRLSTIPVLNDGR